jgi:uncharacterized protein YndB with AHSA1/START domain
MVTFSHDITIERPLEEVFAFMEDHENRVHWQKDLVHNKHEPLRNGAKVQETRNFLGKALHIDGEIANFAKDKGWTFEGKGPHLKRLKYTYRFSKVAKGTQVHTDVEVEAPEMAALADPILKRMAQRDTQHAMEHLKDVLEAEDHIKQVHEALPEHEHHKARAKG